MRIRFTVEGKPVPLHRARAVRLANGKLRMYTPEESVRYQELVRRTAVFAGCPVFAKGCRVEMVVYFPDRRTRDLDNCGKSVLDALQANTRLCRRAIAWNNDNDVSTIVVERGIDPERPRIEVTITGELAQKQR